MSITIDLTTNVMRQEIDLKEERRITLINKITKIDKSFNADEYLKSTDYDYIKKCYPPEGEYNKIRDKTFLIYSPDNTMVDKVGLLKKATSDILLNRSPIIREYITKIDD